MFIIILELLFQLTLPIVAKKEEENYNRYKAQYKKVYNEVGTPGGGLVQKPKPAASSSNLSNKSILRVGIFFIFK